MYTVHLLTTVSTPQLIYIVQDCTECTVYTVKCIMYNVNYTVQLLTNYKHTTTYLYYGRLSCKVYSAPCTVYSVQCTE